MQIDWWTLALQTVNVVVLIWILSRFFFRPLHGLMIRRQAEVAQASDQARAAREAAEAEKRAAEAERESLSKQRKSVLEAAETEGRTLAEALKEQARREITNEREEAAAKLAQMETASRRTLTVEAGKLAVEIARRLLARLPADVQFQVFLEGLCKEIRRDRDSSANGWATPASEPFEIVTAAPLSEVQIQQTRKALNQALGIEPRLDFRVDPGLLAGLELSGAHTRARNSWAADLERIRAELADVGRAA